MGSIVATGSWDEIKRLKRIQKGKVDSRRLHDATGRLVESCERAETFAKHLEAVQWAVRPMNDLQDRPQLGATLGGSQVQ